MSFGEELRRERELREISLRDISEATKISVRYLQALESNDFTELPGGVFNRGFVRAYAQYIGIDPDGSVDAYIHEETQQAEGDSGEEDYGGVLRGGGRRARTAGISNPDANSARIWILFAAFVVLLAAIGLIAWFLILPSLPERPSALDANGPQETTSATLRKSDGAASDPSPSDDTPVPLPSSRHSGGAVVTRILIDEATQGRINCDDRQSEQLGGILPGTRLELACSDFISIDAADGGAIRIGLGGEIPRALGPDGQRVDGYRVSIPEWLERTDGGAS